MIDLQLLRKAMQQSIKEINHEKRLNPFSEVVTLSLDDGTRLVFRSDSEIVITHEGAPVCSRCKGCGWIDPNGEYGNPTPCRDCNTPTYRIPPPR